MAGIRYFIKCGQKKSLLVTLPRQNILVANSIPVNNLHHVYHTVMEVYNIKKECFWSTSKEIECAQRKILWEKFHKQWIVRARKPPKKVYRFLLHWTETIHFDPKEHKKAKTTDDFKNKLKGWIWENIP